MSLPSQKRVHPVGRRSQNVISLRETGTGKRVNVEQPTGALDKLSSTNPHLRRTLKDDVTVRHVLLSQPSLAKIRDTQRSSLNNSIKPDSYLEKSVLSNHPKFQPLCQVTSSHSLIMHNDINPFKSETMMTSSIGLPWNITAITQKNIADVERHPLKLKSLQDYYQHGLSEGKKELTLDSVVTARSASAPSARRPKPAKVHELLHPFEETSTQTQKYNFVNTVNHWTQDLPQPKTRMGATVFLDHSYTTKPDASDFSALYSSEADRLKQKNIDHNTFLKTIHNKEEAAAKYANKMERKKLVAEQVQDSIQAREEKSWNLDAARVYKSMTLSNSYLASIIKRDKSRGAIGYNYITGEIDLNKTAPPVL